MERLILWCLRYKLLVQFHYWVLCTSFCIVLQLDFKSCWHILKALSFLWFQTSTSFVSSFSSFCIILRLYQSCLLNNSLIRFKHLFCRWFILINCVYGVKRCFWNLKILHELLSVWAVVLYFCWWIKTKKIPLFSSLNLWFSWCFIKCWLIYMIIFIFHNLIKWLLKFC